MDPKQVERMPLFASLDKRERQRIAQQADEVEVAEGKQLASEGELAYEFFVIEEGTAAVDVGGTPAADLGPGDFFGEIGSLQTEHRRRATVTAKTPMKLVVMTAYDFRSINRDVPDVARKVQEAMRERLSAGVT